MKTNRLKLSIRLISLVSEMSLVMLGAITLGVLGFLAAIFIPVLGAYGVITTLNPEAFTLLSIDKIIILIVILAISRGLLRYGEQAANHYIAFKILAIIRDKVFKKLRKLSPSKLDNIDSGEMVSMITTDVELLEVFYAHTISPVAIAIITNGFILYLIAQFDLGFAIIGFVSYILVGVVIPYATTKLGNNVGVEYRDESAKLSNLVLEGLYGLDEIIKFNQKETYGNKIIADTASVNQTQMQMRNVEGIQLAITNTAILLTGLISAYYGYTLLSSNSSNLSLLVGYTLLMSSFGPVVALSNLANNLLTTFASAARVLALLDEKVITEDIALGEDLSHGDIIVENLSYSYNHKAVLTNLSTVIEKGKITGISGPSGCGKSTLLKLLMRFYEVDDKMIKYHDIGVNKITTTSLRNNIAFVDQETFLFNSTIRENMIIAKQDATDEQIINSLKEASIYQFIESLPDGIDTVIGENGSKLSGGERQRIGLARALLTNSDYIFLDEPSANLDTLNEGVILKSLSEIKNKTIIIISHRRSTLSICDKVIDLEKCYE